MRVFLSLFITFRSFSHLFSHFHERNNSTGCFFCVFRFSLMRCDTIPAERKNERKDSGEVGVEVGVEVEVEVIHGFVRCRPRLFLVLRALEG